MKHLDGSIFDTFCTDTQRVLTYLVGSGGMLKFKQARKLQDAQAEKLTSSQADKLTI